VSIVPLGISMDGYVRRDPPARRSRDIEPIRVGYFARVAPEKGLDVLVDAYIRMRRQIPDVPVRLEVAGYLPRAHAGYLARCQATMTDAGLGSEFTYRGEVDREGKLAFLRAIDVLSVPATYDEPKGLFLLEAMASGVPVVQPRRGGFTEIVERTTGGLLVERNDAGALAEGLRLMCTDAGLRARLAASAFEGVRAHYTVAHSATRLLDVYASVLGRRADASVA
jgi:glycosyltransferase involved in cell wall biosynthesis